MDLETKLSVLGVQGGEGKTPSFQQAGLRLAWSPLPQQSRDWGARGQSKPQPCQPRSTGGQGSEAEVGMLNLPDFLLPVGEIQKNKEKIKNPALPSVQGTCGGARGSP